MVMDGADEYRGLMEFPGKIDWESPLDQPAEDPGTESLAEETAQDGLSRTRLRLPEGFDCKEHQDDGGNAGHWIKEDAVKRGV